MEISTFNNSEFGEIRTIQKNGEVLFCGADIAKALGYSNTRDALSRHCKGVVKCDTPTNGGVQLHELLTKVKQNLILEHSEDDILLVNYIAAAVSYAESYQHIEQGYYTDNPMPPTTEQAVIMLSSHFYESRDGSTGGFFGDNVQAGKQVWDTVNLLLRLDRRWKV